MNRRNFIKALACLSLVPVVQAVKLPEIIDCNPVPTRAERIEVNVNAGKKIPPEIIITDNLGRQYKFDCKEIEINLKTDYTMDQFLGREVRMRASDKLYGNE